MLSEANIMKLLKATGFDNTEDIWWRDHPNDPSRLGFYVNTNDVFHWGTADADEITDENVDRLIATYDEMRDVDGYKGMIYASVIWAARERGMRPQGALISKIDAPGVRQRLLDAGPEREIDHWNPKGAE